MRTRLTGPVFLGNRRFDEMVARGALLEHATVFGNCYGTPRQRVDEALAAGRDVVGDLDWQGAQQLTKTVRSDLVSVFVLPPSRAELETRPPSGRNASPPVGRDPL